MLLSILVFKIIFINTETSVMQTPSLFISTGIEETGYTWSMVMYELIPYSIAYAIFSRKYNWNNDWVAEIKSKFIN